MKLSPEARLVLLLSQPAPSALVMQEVQTVLDDISKQIDYDWLIQLANLNQVTPLLYKNLLAVQVVPHAIIQLLQKHYIMTLQRNAAHIEETLQLIDILRSAGIRSIPLKGSFAAETLLGDMGLYSTSDIDLLILWDDLKKAREILIASGYDLIKGISEQDQLTGSYHLYFHKDPTVLELHWNLVRRYFQAPSVYWWEDVQDMTFRGVTLPCLSNEKYLLYLIFRLFSKGLMPLHHAVLMPMLLSQGFDWEKFMASADKLKMKRLTLFTLKFLHDSWGINIPESLTNKHLIGYELLKRFVIRGMFTKDVKPHLRMAVLLLLLDSPVDIFRVLLRRILPSPAEVRLRYNIPHGSLKILPYYLLNPLIMMFRKTKR
ncbi:MAG: nucleotidyltransferase family protein [Nitrospirota bacterium]|nr:nucleotidyltransferase family protein [Nitrospirota bacterium]